MIILSFYYLIYLIFLNKLCTCTSKSYDYDDYEFHPGYSDKTTEKHENTKPIETTTSSFVGNSVDSLNFKSDEDKNLFIGLSKPNLNISEKYFDNREDDFLLYPNQNSILGIKPKSDYVYNRLINDYRIPNVNQRNLFRMPLLPMPSFPVSYPLYPSLFQPQQTSPRPQSQLSSQNSLQPQSSPPIPSGVSTGLVASYPTVYPTFLPNLMQNSLYNNNMQQWNNLQLQNAISNIISRNSFLGFIDPLIIIAIIAIPVIVMLGFSSIIMPFIPVVIYILNIFFPISSAASKRRKKRFAYSIKSDSFHNLTNHDLLFGLNKLEEISQLEHNWSKLQHSLCKF